MTTKKFAKYLEKQCKEIINFSLEPLFEEYVVLVSGKRVGVIYQEKLYVLYAPTFENVEEMIPDFETVNLFSWEYYNFIEIKDIEDKEKLQDIINYVYHELYFAKEIVIDIGFLFQSFRGYPDRIYKLYQEHITFLHFAYENKLLKVDPLDSEGRIIKLSYTNNDLPKSNPYFDYDLKNNRFSFPLVHEFEETCGNGKMTSERIYYRFDGKHFVKEKKTKK